MREKLLRLIGPAAYSVHIETFHSFANSIIKTYPDHFPRIIGSEHMEEIEQIRIIRDILDTLPLRILRPKNDPLYYVKPTIGAIKELKRENVSAREFSSLVKKGAAISSKTSTPKLSPGRRAEKERYALKNKELARVYAAYEKELAKKRLYDFEDMIMEVVRVLARDKNLLLRLQEEYHYILADEHQDANNAQNRLLELLSSFHEHPNLFIVGDEKQAIFRFQGASLENFLYFQRLYKDARVVTLTESFRSHQKILDAAHSLIIKNQSVGEPRYPSLTGAGGRVPRKIVVASAADRVSERAFIAEEIRERVKRGAAANEIAVLVRENKDADPIAETLRAAGFPVAKFSDADALSNVRIAAFVEFLEAVVTPSDEKLGEALFFDFLGLNSHDAFALLQTARKNKHSVLLTLRRSGHTALAALLARLGTVARNESLVAGFGKIAEESGFLPHLISLPRGNDLLPIFEALLRAAERFAERNKLATVKTFLEYLAEGKEHNLEISAEGGAPYGVRVLTAHRAKGLEFDSVFIVRGNDGMWGGRRNRALFRLPIPALAKRGETEDERRLFYVAMTRARKDVTISYALRGNDGRERLPSRFLAEISDEHKVVKTVTPKLPRRRAVVSPPQSLADKKYFQSLFLERGLSVTHLNNFLKCPWRYFFVDLARIPLSQSPALLYGSAIHAALKRRFDAYSREEDLPLAKTFRFFEAMLRRTYLSEKEFRAHLREGKRELKGYLSRFEFPRTIWNEYRIAGVPFSISPKVEILLNGSLDKIELLPDGSVNVVDYKTGRPRTRADIEGKTKSSDGNYKRQLVFYRLLLDGMGPSTSLGQARDRSLGAGPSTLRRAGKWRMKTGAIDFIMPDERGRYRREIFEITDTEVADLKKLTADVGRQIFSLSFWNKTCGDSACKWCRLRQLSGFR
jgi:DNA helicase-2/ATP-dependent DNA helicase PcrA